MSLPSFSLGGSGEACHLLSPIPTCHVCGSHHPARFENGFGWISILGQVYNILTVIYSSHVYTYVHMFHFSRSRAHLSSVPLLWHCHCGFDSFQPQTGADQLQPAAPGTQSLTWGNMTATCSEHVQSVNEYPEYLTDLTDLTDLRHALLYSELVSLEWCWMATDWAQR